MSVSCLSCLCAEYNLCCRVNRGAQLWYLAESGGGGEGTEVTLCNRYHASQSPNKSSGMNSFYFWNDLKVLEEQGDRLIAVLVSLIEVLLVKIF